MTMPEKEILPHAIDVVDGVVVVVVTVSEVFSPGEMLSFSVKTNSFNIQNLLLGQLVKISSIVHYRTAQRLVPGQCRSHLCCHTESHTC